MQQTKPVILECLSEARVIFPEKDGCQSNCVTYEAFRAPELARVDVDLSGAP